MNGSAQVCGRVVIVPPLNEDEQAYVAAFTRSRRGRRDGGPYAVPGNPAAEDGPLSSRVPARLARPAGPAGPESSADDQPSQWCPWTVCWDGCCLALDVRLPRERAGDWMRYLIDHFFRTGAFVSSLGLRDFRVFTFDHRLDGVVVSTLPEGRGRQTLLIVVTNNSVYDELMTADDPRLATGAGPDAAPPGGHPR